MVSAKIFGKWSKLTVAIIILLPAPTLLLVLTAHWFKFFKLSFLLLPEWKPVHRLNKIDYVGFVRKIENF